MWLGMCLSGRRHHSYCASEALGSICHLKIESGVCSGVFVLVVVVFIMQGLTQYQKTNTKLQLVPNTSSTCLSSWLQMHAYAMLDVFWDGINVRLVWPKAHKIAQPGLNLPASPLHLVGLEAWATMICCSKFLLTYFNQTILFQVTKGLCYAWIPDFNKKVLHIYKWSYNFPI